MHHVQKGNDLDFSEEQGASSRSEIRKFFADQRKVKDP